MKTCLAGAMALSFALTPLAALPTQAEEPVSQFRTVEPQTFTSEDLQRYGLSAEDAERAMALQEQGYEIMVLSPEEAEQYTAGITDTEWLLIGILILAVVIAVG